MEFLRKVQTHVVPLITDHEDPLFLMLSGRDCSECGEESISFKYVCMKCDCAYTICYGCAERKGEYQGNIPFNIDDFKLVPIGNGAVSTEYHDCIRGYNEDIHMHNQTDSEGEPEDECEDEPCECVECKAEREAYQIWLQERREEAVAEREDNGDEDDDIPELENEPDRIERLRREAFLARCRENSPAFRARANLYAEPASQVQTSEGGSTENLPSYQIQMDEEVLDEDLRL